MLCLFTSLTLILALLLLSLTSAFHLPVNTTRLSQNLRHLALLSSASPPSVTRVLYTASDLSARAFLRALITSAGLRLREDSVGNIFARLPGSAGGVVGSGSHYDAIPASGAYDGTVGVLGALEALLTLREGGFAPRKALEVLAFTSEEPTRFGLSCLGSRALVGDRSMAELREMRDGEDVGFEEARNAAGYDGEEDVVLEDGYYDAFLELHIEQGKRLEDEELDIGVVTAIAGPYAADAVFEGPGGHAGGMIMTDRHDALLAAAEFALAVEAAARASPSDDTVATVGVLDIEPGAENSIGRRVRASLDARDTDKARRDQVVAAAKKAVDDIGDRRGVKASFTTRSDDAPAVCADAIVSAVESAAKKLGYSYRKLVSRAYHDSLLMARKFPVGMVFIPCRNGVSHHPDEFSSEVQIEKGVRTLALALAELAGGEWSEASSSSGEGVYDEL